MFKKRFVLLGVAAVIVCTILIPPVRAAAVSALSIFRVAETKTITISVNDLREMLAFVEEKNTDVQQQDEAHQMLTQLMEKAEAEVQTLSDARDFTAFPFSLPAALQDETPILSAVDTQAQSEDLDIVKLNAALLQLGATTLVKDSFNGATITVNTPPAIVAEYADVMLAATQNIYIDAPEAVVNNLWSAILSVPAIPEDLRAQLRTIDPETRDVYLPVIEGLGRETDLGGTTGYIYASADLAQVLGMLPGFADTAALTHLQDENASALIWTKNGVLYILAGVKSDSALSQIARSVR